MLLTHKYICRTNQHRDIVNISFWIQGPDSSQFINCFCSFIQGRPHIIRSFLVCVSNYQSVLISKKGRHGWHLSGIVGLGFRPKREKTRGDVTRSLTSDGVGVRASNRLDPLTVAWIQRPSVSRFTVCVCVCVSVCVCVCSLCFTVWVFWSGRSCCTSTWL